MLSQCDVCAGMQMLCCCSTLILVSEMRGATGGAVGAVSGPIGSSNIWARSAGSGGGAASGAAGATDGAGSATGGVAGGTGGAGSATGGAAGGTAGAPSGGGADAAVFPGVGPDASEEEEERQENAEVVTLAEEVLTLAEEEPVRLASQWLRHRFANTVHGTPTAALGSPVSACPSRTPQPRAHGTSESGRWCPMGGVGAATVSSSDASSASSTRTGTACTCIC